MHELLTKTKTHAVIFVELGDSTTDDRIIDHNLAVLKKRLETPLSDYKWRVEDVIDRG